MISAARLFAVLLLAAAAAMPVRAATLFDPALRFRVIATHHFRIYFHQGEERMAAKLAVVAESTWTALDRPLGLRPPLTHVILADQTELPNGYATPLPRNTIVIFPTWPLGAEFDVNDWLRLVFTHEFTHIVHLDRANGWARALRRVFGRTLIAFPNMFLPTWQIEGLATYEESTITGEGRLHAGDFRAIVDEAARVRTLEPLDRVNGGLTDWPGGSAPYAYGALFHQYLADRFGEQKISELVDATAERVPYTSSRVFKRVFGSPLGDLWRDFEAAQISNAARAESSPATRLTHDGYVAAAPRFDRGDCRDCPPSVVYAARNPHDFPALNRLTLDGTKPKRIADRYFGTTTGTGPRALYFDQLELTRNVALYGDLYELARQTGNVRRITWNARVHDPDLSPDGSSIACVQEAPGERRLVIVRLNVGSAAEIAPLVEERDTQFNAPRWSPDGRQIAVVRHRLGADPEIVVVVVATRTVSVVASLAGHRIVMPAWTPDGRAIIAAVAPEGRPFNLVEFGLGQAQAMRQLTFTTGGATWPDVSPDGHTIVFVGYTTEGYDLFSMPLDGPTGPTGRTGRTGRTTYSGLSPIAGRDESNATPYSPLPTLAPTSWQPIIEADDSIVRLGAAVDGVDVLGYHAYTASATWLISAPESAIRPRGASPDWLLTYAYDRWKPTLFVTASRETTFFDGPATDAGTPSPTTRRELQVEAGVILPILHTRVRHRAFAALARATNDYTLPDRSFSRNRTAVRGSWQTRTARTYGFSISPENGFAVGATAELTRRGLGSSGDSTTVTADARGYLRGFGRHHVVAARLGAGRSTGDTSSVRTFLLGGAGPDENAADFGSGAISVLRGFRPNTFAGTRIALLNLEYRVPLARPQRGIGTWPLFFHTLHAAAFADAGQAWTRSFDANPIRTSVGAELAANIVAGFQFPVTLTVGAARGQSGRGTSASQWLTYVRVGRSF